MFIFWGSFLIYDTHWTLWFFGFFLSHVLKFMQFMICDKVVDQLFGLKLWFLWAECVLTRFYRDIDRNVGRGYPLGKSHIRFTSSYQTYKVFFYKKNLPHSHVGAAVSNKVADWTCNLITVLNKYFADLFFAKILFQCGYFLPKTSWTSTKKELSPKSASRMNSNPSHIPWSWK